MAEVDARATTVAILAGGRGERMGGVDKGLLRIGSTCLVERVIAELRRQGIERALIVANRSHDAYARHATVIADAEPGFRGPMAGVAAARDACATRWLLSVPVDCPDPPPMLFARLAAAARSGEAGAFVAHDGERRQPLFALYRQTLAGDAAEAAVAGIGVHAWQEGIGAHEVDFGDASCRFANLNTPAELAAHAQNHDG